mgnify:CR=1 FL=1
MIDSYVGTSEALTSGPFIIQALATAVGAPIVEELMFRGVIYRRLRRMAGVIPSAIIVSLLFWCISRKLDTGTICIFVRHGMCLCI